MLQEGEPPAEAETVREWSHWHNKALWDKQELPDALRFLLEKSALCSRHLEAFIEDFKLDPEAALPHLQLFLTASARSLATGFDIETFSGDARLLQVAAAISKSQYAVISGWQDELGIVRDVLWDQEGLFLKLISCDNVDLEVRTIMDDVPEVPTLSVDSAGLDEVLRVMSVSRVRTVGLMDDAGRVRSVVRYQDIFKAFVREMTNMYCSDDQPGLAKSLQSLQRDESSEEFEFDDEVCMCLIQTGVEIGRVSPSCATFVNMLLRLRMSRRALSPVACLF